MIFDRRNEDDIPIPPDKGPEVPVEEPPDAPHSEPDSPVREPTSFAILSEYGKCRRIHDLAANVGQRARDKFQSHESVASVRAFEVANDFSRKAHFGVKNRMSYNDDGGFAALAADTYAMSYQS